METIKSSEDITRIFERGKWCKTRDIVFIVLKVNQQHGHHGRVAFIAGKKNGNAVWRNRAKRRMRAVCRDINGPFPGFDVVFLATRNTNRASYSEMVEKSRKAMKRTVEEL